MQAIFAFLLKQNNVKERSCIKPSQMESGVKYRVESIKKVIVTKNGISVEKTLADIYHPIKETCHSIFLPNRYNKAVFLEHLPIEFYFEELTVEYLGDIVLGYNQPTPKLFFKVKTSQRSNDGSDLHNVYSQIIPTSVFDEDVDDDDERDVFDEDTQTLQPPQEPVAPLVLTAPPPPPPSTPVNPKPSTSTGGLTKRAANGTDDKKKNLRKKARIIMLSDDDDDELLMSAAKAADTLMR